MNNTAKKALSMLMLGLLMFGAVATVAVTIAPAVSAHEGDVDFGCSNDPDHTVGVDCDYDIH